MAQRTLKRGSNLDGVYYPPGSKVDGEVFTNPKLYMDPEDVDVVDLGDTDEVEEPVIEADTRLDPEDAKDGAAAPPTGPPKPTGEGSKPAPAKRSAAKKTAAKKTASSSS